MNVHTEDHMGVVYLRHYIS